MMHTVEELIAGHRNIVEEIVKEFNEGVLTRNQLIEAGNAGLRKAAEKYGPVKDYDFKELAAPVIRLFMNDRQEKVKNSFEYNLMKAVIPIPENGETSKPPSLVQ